MQNLIDLPVAGFIFLLFASIYRKRNTAAIRFWMLGWLFVLLHFAALSAPVHGSIPETLQAIVALGMLALCAVSFVLSREESHKTPSRKTAISLLLGVPWLAAIILAVLPHPWFFPTVLCAYLGAFSIAILGMRFGTRYLQTTCILLLSAGCIAWLSFTWPAHDVGTVLDVVLTECFGLNAVLLSSGLKRLSTASLTVGIGSIAWGAVWAVGELVDKLAPHATFSPEIWNLPKYFVAAGMVLMLLDEEIRSAELASEEYRLLFAGNPHPMWMYDPETFEFLEANDAAVASYGFGQDEFRSMTLLDVLAEDQTEETVAKLRDRQPQQLSGQWKHRRKNGSEVQVEVATQRVRQHGRPAMFALMHDVTERQRLHEKLLHQAHHDALTDLPTRGLFEQMFQRALATASDRDKKVAIMCVDFDRFKQINDSYGHAAGDLCLKEVTARIAKRLHGRGALSRSGGDEFMLFLEDLQRSGDAETFAGELLADLRASIDLGGGETEMGASIGFALYPDDGREPDQLWRDADAAMYQAKRAGGNQWVRVSLEISSSASQANEIELALRRSLKAETLEVFYQPQMLMNGRFHSMEALLRSRDPILRNTPVDRMIAIAEESGLIVPLGNWVLEEVCRQCRSWLDEGLSPAQVAVNVSPLQITRFDFSRQVARTLARYHLHARMLEFEVTESTVMPEHGGDAPHQIAALSRMGIKFSIDDFGKGYSSLGRLHELPVESLKIDQAFTKHIAKHNGTFPTVEAIIILAHTFGMKVVAEGVEDEEQLRLLRSLGCDRVQGFLFSRPLSAEATTSFLGTLAEDTVRQSVA